MGVRTKPNDARGLPKGGRMSAERVELFGVPMDALTMEQTIEEIRRRIDAGSFVQHVVVNVAKLVSMQQDESLRRAVTSCDIINVDGMGVVWGARFLGRRIPERVAGIDLFWRLLELAAVRGYPVFFLGAKPDVLEQAVANVKASFPALKIAGRHHGYFWDDEEAVVDAIARSGAVMLFVGISSPKKEQFIDRYRERLGVRFAMGVGGSFEVVAGKAARAPRWIQNAGGEWLFRMLQEPRRMWRRYLPSNARFGWMLLRERLRGGRLAR